MFLLNNATKEKIKGNALFTIQNVPIKCVKTKENYIKKHNLQYKMFLLNLIFFQISF